MTDETHPAPGWRPKSHSTLTIVIIVVCALAAILAILAAWDLPPFNWGTEKTENAYVRGRTTIIASQASGYIAAVLVKDYQHVKKGQLLVQIDDDIYRARVAQAKANLDAALAGLANNRQAHASSTASLGGQSAALTRARADMARVDALVTDGSISLRERDQTRATLAQAQAADEVARQSILTVDVGRQGLEAQVEAARAQLRLAQIDLDHTQVRAPESGQLGEVGVRLGQYVTNGTQLMALVPNDRWLIANYKEAQTADVRVGQTASFTVDALDGEKFHGHVEMLSPAAGSEFSVLKPDNATGNFIKVPQRIGVRIAIDGDADKIARLRPGMSVEIRIDTHSTP